jgi:hypothetical protein
MLLKHAVVMKKHDHQQNQRFVYFQFGPDEEDAREGAFLSRKNWDEMGQPQQITVRFEPGDQLTTEDHQQNLLDKIPSRLPNVNIGPPATLE